MILVVKDDYNVQRIGTLAKHAKGTDQTAAAIWGVVKVGAQSSEVLDIARKFNTPQDIYNWLVAYVRFHADPLGVELIRTPQSMIRTIRRKGIVEGDCDDMATLGTSLLVAIGKVPALIVTHKQSALLTSPNRKFQHILFGFRAPLSSSTLADPTDEAWGVLPMDPQERRPIGHKIPEPVRRIYVATGPHAA